jgi:lactate dehydrogenase-like 2-hydroxyacid dehydrogenase
MTTLQQQGMAAKAATYTLATAGTAKKNQALNAIADVLTARQDEWLAANAQDVEAAKAAGITVFHTPGRNAESVSDFTVGMMLCEARNIARGH